MPATASLKLAKLAHLAVHAKGGNRAGRIPMLFPVNVLCKSAICLRRPAHEAEKPEGVCVLYTV